MSTTVSPLAHAVYAKSIGRARKLGALTGYVHGTSSIKEPQVQGGLRLQENIIRWVTESALILARQDQMPDCVTAHQIDRILLQCYVTGGEAGFVIVWAC